MIETTAMKKFYRVLNIYTSWKIISINSKNNEVPIACCNQKDALHTEISTEVHLELCQLSEMELFVKIVKTYSR